MGNPALPCWERVNREYGTRRDYVQFKRARPSTFSGSPFAFQRSGDLGVMECGSRVGIRYSYGVKERFELGAVFFRVARFKNAFVKLAQSGERQEQGFGRRRFFGNADRPRK